MGLQGAWGVVAKQWNVVPGRKACGKIHGVGCTAETADLQRRDGFFCRQCGSSLRQRKEIRMLALSGIRVEVSVFHGR